MSIRNITNLTELTERRVLEEQEDLADLVYSNLQEKLNEICYSFSDQITILDEDNFSAIRFSDTIAFVEQPFIIDKRGELKWPAFKADIENSKESFSSGYNKSFSAGEKYEFYEKNYPRALSFYQRAGGMAIGKADSAQAINAIGRLSMKTRNNEDALKYYSILLTDHYATLDKNGLPYINYAIPQLIKIADTGNSYFILERIANVLSKIVSGEIPINYSTEILLDEINAFILDYSLFDPDSTTIVRRDIEKIKAHISFLMRYEEVIKDFVLKDKRIQTMSFIEDYYFISGKPVQDHEVIMINTNPDHSFISGFVINLDTLSDYSIDVNIPSSFRFEYELSLINGNTKPVSRDEGLTTISKWSPISPNRSIKIQLKDENLLKEQVNRSAWIYGIAIILLIGGMILGVFLIIRDINRERYLSKLRSEFVSNVTHELKTPLTSIYMFAESILLGRVKTESDQKEYLGIILKETERLKRLINNILDFSRGEKGRLDYNFSYVNVSELVESSISNLDYWIEEEKFTIRTSLEENVYGHIDPDALKQAVINLLSNAIKYSQDKKEIHVNLHVQDGLIFIEVADKGIGIPEEEIRNIFQKFYRVESRETMENSGTGLGLTLVKEIVEAHKGRIKVDSEIGKGSTFTIILNSL